MRVFKFGGASVKDSTSIKNVASVVKKMGYKDLLIVISAMGKMTNAFEEVIKSYYNQKDDVLIRIDEIEQFHTDLAKDLFDENDEIILEIKNTLNELKLFTIRNKSEDFNFVYDQMICYGEVLSTKIVSKYFNSIGIKNDWLDARKYIKTNDSYRDAKINWEQTSTKIKTLKNKRLNITQGFIGSNQEGYFTSLGREGSDYSAAIFAYCTEAKSVTIWKDVDGVLNADPRYFEKRELLQEIPYCEAIELAYYGASVIHPKTIQPLKNKGIPLNVKSFVNPEKKGTIVSDYPKLKPFVPCFIVKKKQVSVEVSDINFDFIIEEHLSEIFNCLHKYNIKVNLMQNSAISFSLCVDDKFDNIDKFIDELKEGYSIKKTENVSLYSIIHFTQKDINNLTKDKQVLIKQTTENTVQLVVK